MAKTRQVGVRFDEELLKKVKDAGLATSPQKALNLYERSYLELIELKVENNNKPENKAKIEAERDTVKKLPTQTITTPKEALVEVKIPKNLQELKNMCPKNLGGVDKLLWLETEKVKYNF